MDKQRITLSTLDNFPRFLFWPVDEFLFFAIPFFLGIFTGWVYFIPAGVALKWFYTKSKRKMARGSITHRMYWLLPKSVLKRCGLVKNVPPSHYRELIL